MNERYNISVQTLLERYDGSSFYDMGTMRWFGVDEDIRAWLSASCKKTAFWLIGFDKVTEGESFTLSYRTRVETVAGDVVSDTGLVEFDAMSYEDVLRFEEFATGQLDELRELFKAKHENRAVVSRKRSKVLALIGLIKHYVRQMMRK